MNLNIRLGDGVTPGTVNDLVGVSMSGFVCIGLSSNNFGIDCLDLEARGSIMKGSVAQVEDCPFDSQLESSVTQRRP